MVLIQLIVLRSLKGQNQKRRRKHQRVQIVTRASTKVAKKTYTMLDVVSSMAGRYLEGGGGEVASCPQLNQREGGEKAPLLVSTTLARRARVEMFATFYGSGKVSFSDQFHSFL